MSGEKKRPGGRKKGKGKTGEERELGMGAVAKEREIAGSSFRVATVNHPLLPPRKPTPDILFAFN